MNLTIEIPEEIVRQLKQQWPDVPRRVLEATAVEGYRTGALTRGQVSLLLGLSWHETEALLRAREAWMDYDEADLMQDEETLRRLNSL